MQAAGVGDGEMDDLRNEAQSEMIAALAEAAAAPFPPDDAVFQDVQDIGSPVVDAY